MVGEEIFFLCTMERAQMNFRLMKSKLEFFADLSWFWIVNILKGEFSDEILDLENLEFRVDLSSSIQQPAYCNFWT